MPAPATDTPKEQDSSSGTNATGGAAGLTGRLLSMLGHAALNNGVAIIALIVASSSLYVSLIDRQENRMKEMLAVTMLVEPVEQGQVFIAAPKETTSPFRPPYLMFPVRIFVMNGSTLPQTITEVWISFDKGPDDKIKFVKLEGVHETDGKLLSWPKTIMPRGTVAFDANVPIPVPTQVLAKVGYRTGKPKSAALGSAGRLRITINERTGPDKDVFADLQQEVTFSLRLMSPSPGSPNHLLVRRRLP